MKLCSELITNAITKGSPLLADAMREFSSSSSSSINNIQYTHTKPTYNRKLDRTAVGRICGKKVRPYPNTNTDTVQHEQRNRTSQVPNNLAALL